MTRLPIMIAMLAGSLSLATAARSADDENTADVRCVVIAFELSQSPDPQLKSLATTAGLYFVGRLSGRAPELDLEAAMLEQFKAMSVEDRQSEQQRCGAILEGQANRLVVMAHDMQSRVTVDRSTPPTASPPK